MILSDEVSDFIREIKIDSEATFLDLHHAIIKSAGYAPDQMCSFFICDDDWSRRTEITLIDMDKSSEEDNYIMENTRLEELLEDEDEKLVYVFDYLTERSFFIELREIIPGKRLAQATCARSEGVPPPQTVDFDAVMDSKTQAPSLLSESFYGDSEYDPDELDHEGFDGLENTGNPFDEEHY
jgi:hypothetical protein